MEQNQTATKRERQELFRQEKKQEELLRYRSRFIKKWIKISVPIFLAIASIGGLIWYSATQPTIPTSEMLSLKADDWVKGNKDAQVTLIEYLDFEACGAYYPLIKRLSEEFKNDVKLVIRYFPLAGHRNGLPAALAVEAASKQGKYWEMYDILFENQSSWGERPISDPTIFEEYAKKIGLDIVKFKQDVNLPEVKDRIERDRNSGIKLGVQGTPTFFLNGKKIDNPRGYDDFKTLIESTIKKVQ
jgi:protein-disulfide isomerase